MIHILTFNDKTRVQMDTIERLKDQDHRDYTLNYVSPNRWIKAEIKILRNNEGYFNFLLACTAK